MIARFSNEFSSEVCCLFLCRASDHDSFGEYDDINAENLFSDA